ncbi:transcription elongation factor spt5 [Pestalotiopsis sp. IQ-011]
MGFAGTTNYIRRDYDWEDDSSDGSDDNEDLDRNERDTCRYTFSQDQGHEYSDEYVTELHDELEQAKERLRMAEEKLELWRRLYWRSRDEYYFSHGSASGSEQGDQSEDESDGWHASQGEKDDGDAEDGDDDDTKRKLVNPVVWSDIKLSEFHLYRLELEVAEASEDCDMTNAELILCTLRVDEHPPKLWRFDHSSGLRIWNPREGLEVTADDFQFVPENKRSLRHGKTQYN